MKKDIITKERIKQDYQKQFSSSIRMVIVIPIILILLIALIVFLFSLLEFNAMFLTLEIIVLLPAVFGCYICVASLIDAYKDLDTVKSESFRIVTDTLIGIDEKAVYAGSAFFATLFNHPYTLIFDSFGKYFIHGENYSSSELYAMNDKGVYTHAIVGDTYYLVIGSKNKVLAVYNTKMFELAE